MKLPSTLTKGSCALVFSLLLSASAFGQAYPNKPIKLVAAVAPGGSTDLTARVIAEKLSEQLGQPVTVENRGGAGGNIGANYVAKSAPDGYTLLIAVTGATAVNPSVYPNMPYDPVKDLAAVSQLNVVPQMLVINASVPGKDLKEFIAYAKTVPGKLNYASGGIGTLNHLAAAIFADMAGIQAEHIPYNGAAAALTDVLAGRMSFMFTSSLPRGTSDKARPLGVSTDTRSAAVPDVPTLAEAGLPGFNVGTWHGIVAPAGTPPEIIRRLNEEVVKALQDPKVRERYMAAGLEPKSSTPAEFAALIKSEVEKFAPIVKKLGVKAE